MVDRLGRLEGYWRRGYLEPGAYRYASVPLAHIDAEKPHSRKPIRA